MYKLGRSASGGSNQLRVQTYVYICNVIYIYIYVPKHHSQAPISHPLPPETRRAPHVSFQGAACGVCSLILCQAITCQPLVEPLVSHRGSNQTLLKWVNPQVVVCSSCFLQTFVKKESWRNKVLLVSVRTAGCCSQCSFLLTGSGPLQRDISQEVLFTWSLSRRANVSTLLSLGANRGRTKKKTRHFGVSGLPIELTQMF